MLAAQVHRDEAAAKVLTRVIDNTFNHSETVQAQHWSELHSHFFKCYAPPLSPKIEKFWFYVTNGTLPIREKFFVTTAYAVVSNESRIRTIERRDPLCHETSDINDTGVTESWTLM